MVTIASKSTHLYSRPPIVAVLGHVDHGKTTLLDYIRHTNVSGGEAGGITQHIGAYQVEIKNQKSKVKSEEGKITFIDTPGHEAFAKMRSRGTQVADIALLVVSGSDGVMPQTEEAIRYIQKAGVPMIVVINKIDLPEADPQKVKQQLAKVGVLVEGFGGDVVAVPISAKTGEGISELLEMIILVAQLKEIQADPIASIEAVVIEVKHDKRRGVLATLIVKNGTLNLGDTIFAEGIRCRVRALHSSQSEIVTKALPGTPVEVMGWEALPVVGAVVSETKKALEDLQPAVTSPYTLSLPPLAVEARLKLILKTDVSGTLEAIKESLGSEVELIDTGSGEITESDVLLAKSTGALIIGFNTKATSVATRLAQVEKVQLKMYRVIYELLEEIAEVVKILQAPEAQDQVLGEAKILAEFTSSGEPIAGCRVTSGRIARGDLVKLMRGNTFIGGNRIKSLKYQKDIIPKAEVGSECGLSFDKKLDFKIGDLIIAYKKHELLA